MIVFSDEESALLDRIAIDMALDHLSKLDRTLIVFYVAYELPDDYAGPWPPRYADTGQYVSRYLGKPLRSTSTRVRTERILAMWRRAYLRAMASSLMEATLSPPLTRAA